MLPGWILARGAWGGTDAGRSPMPLPARDVSVHHTVTRATGDPDADFRFVDRIGVVNGFRGVSYSWLIHPGGTIGEGQGLKRGAHTKDLNSVMFGVGFIGDFRTDLPTQVAINSFRRLRAWLTDEGLLRADNVVFRHGDLLPTVCPGPNLDIGALAVPPAPSRKVPPMWIAYNTTQGHIGWLQATRVSGAVVADPFPPAPRGAYGIPQAAIDYAAAHSVPIIPIDGAFWDRLHVASFWAQIDPRGAPAAAAARPADDEARIASRVAAEFADRLGR